MAEISKGFKIVILLIVIASLYYAIMYLFLTDLYYATLGYPLHPYHDPWAVRANGITMLCFGIFGLLAVKVADWEKIRLYMQFGIVWLLVSLIEGNLTWLDPQAITVSGGLLMSIVTLVLGIVFIVLIIYFYRQEEKKLQ